MLTFSPSASAHDRWLLADQVSNQTNPIWKNNRYSKGTPSIRVNAMMLQIHARAAVADHKGASRQDQRVNDIARLLCSYPVFIQKTNTRREIGSFPHAPAFTSVYSKHPESTALHPSADSIVIQALTDAYKARDAVDMPVELQEQIKRAVGAVARGKWYSKNQYAENQINWNADVAMADWTVNGYKPSLERYRQSLVWLATYARRPIPGGKLSAFSDGYGFHYGPTHGYRFNQIDSVEYANLVHGSLAYYQSAVNGGMRPLGRTQKARLDRWSDHVLYNWTHAGYLNWDSALGNKRQHLEQYWGFSLWSLARSQSYMTETKKKVVDGIVEAGAETFAANPKRQTMFGARNGFVESSNDLSLIAMRFALADITNFGRSSSKQTLDSSAFATHDKQMKRLAVSTPSYNTAVVGRAFHGTGGIDINRLFDDQQRPLTPLGLGDKSHNPIGIRIENNQQTVLSSQSGSGKNTGNLVTSRTNKSFRFSVLKAKAVTQQNQNKITVEHVFTSKAITTRFFAKHSRKTDMMMIMPVFDRKSKCSIQAKLIRPNRWRAAKHLDANCKTPEGAKIKVIFDNLPANSLVYIYPRSSNAYAPKGSLEIRIRFVSKSAAITRKLSF